MNGHADGAMDTRSFLAEVRRAADAAFGMEQFAPSWKERSQLLQASFSRPAIHYEVWLQRARRQVEVGLHLEAEPELNGWLLRRLTAAGPELWYRLGPEFEPEQWTQWWTRVHATLHYDEVDRALVERTTACLLHCVRVLEPTLATLLAERRP